MFVGRGHQLRPQGEEHPQVPMGLVRDACLVSSSFLSFSPFCLYFSSFPKVNINQSIIIIFCISIFSVWMMSAQTLWIRFIFKNVTFFLFSGPGNPWVPGPEPMTVAATPTPE